MIAFWPIWKRTHMSPTRWQIKADTSDVSLICEANFPANVPAVRGSRCLRSHWEHVEKGRDGVAVETGEQASMFTSVESASVLCYVKLTHIAAGIGWLAPTRLLVSAHAIAHLPAALILFHFLKSSEIWIIELTNTKTPLRANHSCILTCMLCCDWLLTLFLGSKL